MSDTSLLDKYHEATNALDDLATYLESQAGAFAQVGNSYIANRLYDSCDVIRKAIPQIHAYTNDQLRHAVQQGFDTSALLLEATLAGVQIGREAVDNSAE
jgi:hypothetical protein